MIATRRKRNLSAKELWIGLAKVEQSSRDGVLGDADRAFSNAIAIANNRADFRTTVKEALAELGLRLMRLEDAEKLKTRLSKQSISEVLARSAEEVKRTGIPSFGTFHTFDAT